MRTSTLSCACAALVVCLAARTSRAGSETVQLSNGSVYEGELVEKVPGDHVTIKLATGEVRRFDWADLAPPKPPPPPPPPPVAQPLQVLQPQQQCSPAALPARPTHVRFDADARGALLMRVDLVTVNNAVMQLYTTQRTSPVCYAPCSADVDANAHYYVDGAYISRSGPFAIPEGNSRLVARTGSSGVAAAGGWLLFVGVLSVITGAIATPIAFATDRAPAGVGWNGWEYFGVTSLLAGSGLILLSIPFIVAGRTHVGIGDMDVARQKVQWLPNGFRF